MKKLYAISTAIVLSATAASATERTIVSSPVRRVQATGRARATIISPVSAKLTQNMVVTAASNALGIQKYKVSSVEEVYLSGPKNNLFSVNISSGDDRKKTHQIDFKPSLLNASTQLAFSGKTGEAKLKIGGALKTNPEKEQLAPKTYILQVSY